MSPVLDLNYLIHLIGSEAFSWLVFVILALLVLGILAPFIRDSFKGWKF